MNILAVDTAGKTAGVALLQDDRLLYEVYLDAGMTHSETLMPMIDTCLKMCGMTCADIDLYGVNAGPGSFTGLRIGLAAVKGLAFPRETLCAPVSTLEALAAAHTGEGTVLCALDARRAQVYSAAFDLATHTKEICVGTSCNIIDIGFLSAADVSPPTGTMLVCRKSM